MASKSSKKSAVTEAAAQNCIHPRHNGANVPAKTRGLCNNCYHQVLQLVKKGKTTMADLEASGKVLKPAKSASAIAAWFLEESAQ